MLHKLERKVSERCRCYVPCSAGAARRADRSCPLWDHSPLVEDRVRCGAKRGGSRSRPAGWRCVSCRCVSHQSPSPLDPRGKKTKKTLRPSHARKEPPPPHPLSHVSVRAPPLDQEARVLYASPPHESMIAYFVFVKSPPKAITRRSEEIEEKKFHREPPGVF